MWNVIREPLEIFYYDADEIQQDLAPNNRPQQVCRRWKIAAFPSRHSLRLIPPASARVGSAALKMLQASSLHAWQTFIRYDGLSMGM